MLKKAFLKKLDEAVSQGLLTYQVDKPLSSCSTFRIGGPVSFAVYPNCEQGVIASLEAAEFAMMPLRVVGSGSNILFPDEGFEGAILFTRNLCRVSFEGTILRAGAGASLSALALEAAKKGLSGLEFAYGIPGSLGGGVYMNAGAYDHELAEVVVESRYYDRTHKGLGYFREDEHEFAYRNSVYKKQDDLIVLGVRMDLKEDDPLTIRARMDDYMERRRSKQPLEYPSAGSAFKRYPGYFTAKLIDEVGLKGTAVGDAAVSEKHAGFVINKGSATAAQVKELMAMIEERIYEKYGIHIEREIIYF